MVEFSTIIEGNKSKYEIICPIESGEGANSIVYRVKDLSNDTILAAKILKENSANSDKVCRFKKEYEFQRKSSCPYIVRAVDYGVTEATPKPKSIFFYVMNMYSCNYRNIINKENGHYIKNNNKKIKYILDLCKALKYMHSRGIVHRDLKPENILYDNKRDKVLIADLGIAHFRNSNQTIKEDKMANFDYHAPEQKKNGEKNYGPFTDIYALGLIINETFTGKIPAGVDYKKIADCFRPFAFLDDIVSKMLIQDYEKRISDVREVIYLIEKGLDEIQDFKDEVKNKIECELVQRNVRVDSRCKKQIFDDLLLVDKILKGTKMDCLDNFNNMNPNYHCNISYNTNPLVFNSFINYRIYKIISNKFSCESTSNYQTNDLLNFEQNKGVIEKLNQYFKTYRPLKIFENFQKEAVKMFCALKECHINEVFESIEREIEISKENLLDAPLLWLYMYLNQNEFIYIYKESSDDINILFLVELNPYRFSNCVEMDNLFNEDYESKRMSSFIEELKHKYKSIKIIDNEHFSMSIKDSKRLLTFFDNHFVDDGTVRSGDLINFRKSYFEKCGVGVFKLESCCLGNLRTFLIEKEYVDLD